MIFFIAYQAKGVFNYSELMNMDINTFFKIFDEAERIEKLKEEEYARQ